MRSEAVIRAEYKKAQKKADALAQELRVRMDYDRMNLYNDMFKDGITLEGIMNLDWAMIDGQGEWYPKIMAFLEAMPGIHVMGYLTKTRQIGINIKLDQNLPLEDQKGIAQIIPLIKPIDGVKHVQVFEHTLCRFTTIDLRISENDTKFVLYAGSTRQRAFKTLDEALAYIYKNHPYQLLGGAEPEGEDDTW